VRNTFVNILLEKATEDKRIMLLTGDLGYGVVDKFSVELPEQFINFGINEQTMMSAAAGLASQGFKPFVYSIGNFPTFRCLEQIRNDVCYMNLDVTVVALGAGFAYGTAGYSHHLVEDLSAISPLANIKVFSPADVFETEIIAREVVSTTGPKYVRLGKGGEGNLTEGFSRDRKGFSINPGDNQSLILSTGNILSEALKVRDGSPSSSPTIASCFDLSELPKFISENSFRRIVTLEEHVLRGGFGSLVKELSQNSIVSSVGIEKIDSRISGSQKYLRDKYNLTAERIRTLL
jgi:transketolase